MSALELFKVLGDESDRPPSPPKHILKKKKPSQAEKTKRYWPGKVPDYVVEDDSYSDESSNEDEPHVKVDSEPDRRLNRYQITQVEVPEDVSERVRRRKAQVETITVYQSDKSKDLEKSTSSRVLDDKTTTDKVDNEPSERKLDRNTLRRLALEYRKQEEQRLNSMSSNNNKDYKGKYKSNDQEDNEEEEDEYNDDEENEEEDEDDSDNEDNDREYNKNTNKNKQKNKKEDYMEEDDDIVLAKPVFVPKGSRTTEQEKEQLRKEEMLRKENEKKRLEERKRDTKEMLIKKFQEEENELELKEDEENLIDDTDVLDEKEYELWKIRELKRILRDKEEREKFKKLQEEVEMRRNMTDEEREMDNKNIDKVIVEKSKLRFLQKYYHRGAFFMDKLQDKSEPIYARDFNKPTADDCIDKSMLPKPMRVRRGQYGKQGRVKHTHLKDVDTTQFDSWSNSDKYKLTGTKQVFDRPSKKK